jgi:hypothetical protein
MFELVANPREMLLRSSYVSSISPIVAELNSKEATDDVIGGFPFNFPIR